MLKKEHKISKFITIGLTFGIVMIVFILAVYISKTDVVAKATLPGIETIILNNSNESPYVILEVVPNKSEAKLGYLVGGEEPVINGKSIKDMPSKEERNDHFESFIDVPDDLNGNAVSYSQYQEEISGTENALITQIRGIFTDVGVNGNYQHNDTDILYSYEANPNCDGSVDLYMKYATYRKPESGFGEFKIDLIQAETISSMPQKADTEAEENAYNFQFFVASSFETLDDLTVGDVIYLTDNGTSLSYIGMVCDDGSGPYIKKEDSTRDENIDFADYRIVREAQGGDESLQKYCISCITQEPSSFVPYSKLITYREAEKNDDDITYPNYYNYYVKGSGQEYTYKENGDGDTNFIADYTKEVIDTATYSGGFQNEEWLKKNVFDRQDSAECEDLIIDVVPITIDELNSYDLKNANLIYFAGGTTSYSDGTNNQLTSEKAQEIVSEAISNNLPVILTRSLQDSTLNGNNLNLMKLALCLRQKTYSVLNLAKLALNWNDPIWENNLIQSEKEDMSSSKYGSYVNNSVFIYDDLSNGSTPFVSGDFTAEISDEKIIDYGFSDVIKEIEQENFYLGVAGKTERIEDTISKATALRYIVNYGNKRVVVKSKINILDLEPADKTPYTDTTISTYSDGDIKCLWNGTEKTVVGSYHDETFSKEWFIKNIGTQFLENENAVSISLMGTKEFVGNLIDLNENYDMIYVGLDTSMLNTIINDHDKTNHTIYNDSNMNELVYSHIGDSIETGGEINGTYRLPGNDITYDKLSELKEYMKAGYAIMFADGFFKKDDSNKWIVNTSKIDSSSNMYELAKEALKQDNGVYVYYGKNVMIQGELDGNSKEAAFLKENFVKYINLSKLIVTYDQIPTEYNNSNTQQYLTPNNEKICSLNFTVTLKNDAAVELLDTSYNCLLYFDLDADGKFEKNEIQSGLSIANKNSGTEEYTDEDGKYNLKTGNSYQILRYLPEDYAGLLPWKIVFVQNDGTELIRTAKTGFSAVEIKDEKPVIKILQISSGDNTNGGNLDLKNDTQMKELYSEVKDFSVDVTQVSASSFVNKTGFSDYFTYLCNFDMIVMGFSDSYTFNNNSEACKNAILGIREYVLSGRSILFTHDLNSFTQSINQKNGWGYYANIYLRDVQGMDRFGTLSDSALIPNDEKYQYISKYDDKCNNPISGDETGEKCETIAFTSSNSIRYHTGNVKYGENARYSTFRFDPHKTTEGNNFNKAVVSTVNHGQITEYPFHIDDLFSVQHTHAQYYQLNLDTDSSDSNVNDDIVVWYTISDLPDTQDSFYKANKNDVRNNYYIYNKGNITYTGCGDTYLGSDVLMEKKLFVNTLVSAYNAGIHAPKVIYKENKSKTSAEIMNLYIPYDSSISDSGSYLNNQITINYQTLNNNMVNNATKLFAEYYIESTNADYTIRIGNLYLKRVEPITDSFQKIVTDGTNLISQKADAFKLDNYSLYTMKLNASNIGLLSGPTHSSSKNAVNMYIRIGYEELAEGNMDTEPATESLNKLTIVRTDLFDLE